MSGLKALLQLDTSALDAKLSIAADAPGASLSLSITDPLDLLGDAGPLIREIGEIANGGGDLPATLRAAFAELEQLQPFVDLGVLQEVIDTLQTIKLRLAPLKDLMDLDPEAMVRQALNGAPGNPAAILDTLTSEFTKAIGGEIPEAIAAPVAALNDLAGAGPSRPVEVAAFFSRFLLGLDLTVLSGPFEVLAAVEARVAGGTGADALEAQIVDLTRRIDLASEALVGSAPDLPAIVASLATASREIRTLTIDILPQATARLTADIEAIDIAELAGKLDATLAPLMARVPVPPRGLADYFLPPMQMLRDGIDRLDTELIDLTLEEIDTELHAMFAESGITAIRDDARNLLTGVREFLARLPLPELRDQLTQALLGIERKAGEIGSFSPVGSIAARLQAVANAIDTIDTAAVAGRVSALAGEISAFAAGFPTAVADVKTELETLIDAATDIVDGLPALIDALKAEIGKLDGAIGTIDLSAAGTASAGEIRALRDKVNEALASADLPEALRTPLGLLAGQVRKLDLTASLGEPRRKAVASLDISGALAPIQGAIEEARAALDKLSPTVAIKRLDQPFAGLLARLQTISPQTLTNQLSSHFSGAIAELDRLEPTVLIQPLQQEFDAILARTRRAVDPAPLLAPLATVYAELKSLLDVIDPTLLLGRVVGQASQLPGRMADEVATSVAGRVGAAANLPVGDSEPIRFGDVVRPFAALVNEARSVVRGAAEDVLEDGLTLINRPLALLSRAGETAGAHLTAIAGAIERRRRLVDPSSGDGPLAELRAALERLTRTEASLAAQNRSSAALGATVGSLQLEIFVTVSAPDLRGLSGATDQLINGLGSDDIGRGFEAIGRVLSDFAPAAVTLPDTTATTLQRIDALFDALDPTPIADEMDAAGIALQTKLASFGKQLAAGLLRIWNGIFTELLPALPQGLLQVLDEVLGEIRNQLAALDPARLADELGRVLDAVFASLQAYSPAAFAGTLTPSFDALKAKLATLNPAALLGDLTPLNNVLDSLEGLRPSAILQPLADKTTKIDEALKSLLEFDPALLIEAAIEKLTAEIELVLETIEGELDELLGDLERGAGGSGSVSVSASISV
ncbi:hypothetical protein VW23_009440 [Devosia insulae DS-56]|uniref:Uncharacterized protein n=1 Tax=Devosia insulae DS-56 TaxID=1116389 RepID=A0A1E5XW89_9HYPH|nr:hypothetical protein [Devosia insulae]OEO32842.1 hypothetical protein VW23_009440 [Devosia insulae DS-56]